MLALLAVAAFGAPARPAGLPDAFDEIVQKYVAENKFEGEVLVAKGAEVVFNKAYGYADRAWETPLTVGARFPLCQIAEQFAAVLALRRIEEGKLRLDTTVAEVWPDLAGCPNAALQLKDLLGRRSGLMDVESLGPEVSQDTELVPNDVAWFWRTRDPRVRTMEGAARLVLQEKPVMPPGFPQRNNSHYLVVGAMLEAVGKKPFAEMVQEELLTPLGMTETKPLTSQAMVPKLARSALYRMDGWYAGPGVRWENAPALAGFYGTAGDLVKWNLALLDGKVFGPESAKLFFGPAEGEYRNGFGGDWGEVPFGSRRLQVLDHIGAIAAYRAHSSIVVPERLSVIFLSGASNYNPKPVHREANITYELASAALGGGG